MHRCRRRSESWSQFRAMADWLGLRPNRNWPAAIARPPLGDKARIGMDFGMDGSGGGQGRSYRPRSSLTALLSGHGRVVVVPPVTCAATKRPSSSQHTHIIPHVPQAAPTRSGGSHRRDSTRGRPQGTPESHQQTSISSSSSSRRARGGRRAPRGGRSHPLRMPEIGDDRHRRSAHCRLD